MVQVAAALLFAIAAGLGITVIVAMLKSNEDAILSALLGEGAFPVTTAPKPELTRRSVTLRQSAPRRPIRIVQPQLSRAA